MENLSFKLSASALSWRFLDVSRGNSQCKFLMAFSQACFYKLLSDCFPSWAIEHNASSRIVSFSTDYRRWLDWLWCGGGFQSTFELPMKTESISVCTLSTGMQVLMFIIIMWLLSHFTLLYLICEWDFWTCSVSCSWFYFTCKTQRKWHIDVQPNRPSTINHKAFSNCWQILPLSLRPSTWDSIT